MPRKPRGDLAPGLHHVYARGNNKQLLFLDDNDRLAYVALMGQTARRQRWRCLTYCLMPNHVHLLLETTEPNLSDGMRWMHGTYARRFNDRHRRTGHVFQGRFGSVPIQDDAQLWMTVAYIVRNPLEAKLCKTPEEWRWGSHPAVVDGTPEGGGLDVARLLEYMTVFGGDPRRRYAELVGQ